MASTSNERGHRLRNNSNEEQASTGSRLSENEDVEASGRLASSTDRPQSGKTPDNPSSDEANSPSEIQLKVKQLTTVEEFVRFAYQQKGKRLTLPTSIRRKIAAGAKPSEGSEDPLLNMVTLLGKTDPFLAVPPRLLVFTTTSKSELHLRRRLEHTMKIVIRQHPIFASARFQELLDEHSENFESELDELREVAYKMSSDQLGFEAESFNGSHRKKLYANALTSLTLLIALRDEWKVDRIVDLLYRRLWRSGIDDLDPHESIDALVDARDFTALASVGQVLERQRRDLERVVGVAQDEAEFARLRAVSAESELATRDETIRTLQLRSNDLVNEIASLEDSLATEAQGRMHDRSHHLDDYEVLRTRTLRVLTKQVELLSDGLDALREGAVEVTYEFVERTVATLIDEIAQLRRQGG